ncbi:serine hydrolase domain-containing protein [Nocardia altamirensis]|uniref:serine hydrolase domain-containing protein n=1 Tax=Nocardia altamirensis TaxID=472158 RepID=UPI00084037B3|nr:serine hydrolase domain-containing protein [Nocardia altamirensis]
MSPFRRVLERTVLLGATVSMIAMNSYGVYANSEPTESGRAEVMQALDAVVRAGVPGVQVVVSEQGRDWTAAAGVGDIATGARFPDDGRVRIGSVTKSFTATVLLQLVAEGKVELDVPVERYLPGVLPGNGNDSILVRNLLQHTSGLASHTDLPAPETGEILNRWRRFDTADLVRRVLALPPHFAPGAQAEYNNINYLIAGLVIERVTGQPVDVAITRRIIEPLGLQATYYPAAGETALRGPHPSGYLEFSNQHIEYTDMDTSLYGAAGAMVSTGAEVNRFFTALLGGKLLPQAQLDEMKRSLVPLTNRNNRPYGLGLAPRSVSCGKEVWGSSGTVPGFTTYNGVTSDGRAVVVTLNQTAVDSSPHTDNAMMKAFETAMCAAS